MKTAVVLFNLGAPDSQQAVQPFLTNLFSDPAILTLPGIIRWPLARRIARRRAKKAKASYQELGGASPLLGETESQATALEDRLGEDFKIFIAMRYWHPLTKDVVADIEAYDPDEVLLLPLYPQFSTTTTGSSLKSFRAAWAPLLHRARVKALCCYGTELNFVKAYAEQLRRCLAAIRELHGGRSLRILFSAHGLPQKTVDRGDPYAWQVSEMADAVIAELGEPDLDFVVCFQSRVRSVRWLQPYIDQEIRRAGADQVGVLVAPIAFVSEHSETLVELDIELRKLAELEHVPFFERMPTLSADPAFIDVLARLALRMRGSTAPLCSANGTSSCPSSFSACPLETSRIQAGSQL